MHATITSEVIDRGAGRTHIEADPHGKACLMSFNTSSSNPALRRALRVDAAASGTMGLAFAIASRPVSGLLGIPAAVLFWVGLFLFAYAGFLIWLARRPGMPRSLVLAVVVGNLLWVAGSLAILPAGLVELTGLGVAVVLAQAAAVAGFAAMEYDGLRQLQPAQ